MALTLHSCDNTHNCTQILHATEYLERLLRCSFLLLARTVHGSIPFIMMGSKVLISIEVGGKQV